MLKNTSTLAPLLAPAGNASLIVGIHLNYLKATMDSSFFQLLIFSAIMLFGSYLAGTAPMVLPLNEEKLHRVSVFGAGLLVGTALAVIVPEGVQTLIGALSRSAASAASAASASKEHSGHSHDAGHLDGLDRAIGISLVLGFIFMLLVDQCASGKGNLASDLEGGSRGGNVKWTTTLGLVVHAAADGIAMGAAATTHQTDIEGRL